MNEKLEKLNQEIAGKTQSGDRENGKEAAEGAA